MIDVGLVGTLNFVRAFQLHGIYIYSVKINPLCNEKTTNQFSDGTTYVPVFL